MFYFLGAYIGVSIDAKYYKGSYTNMNDTSLKLSLFRIILSAFIILPFYVLPVYFLNITNQPLIVLFLKFGLPTFALGLVLFGYSKLFYKKFNLIKEEDISIESALKLCQYKKSQNLKLKYVTSNSARFLVDGVKLNSF